MRFLLMIALLYSCSSREEATQKVHAVADEGLTAGTEIKGITAQVRQTHPGLERPMNAIDEKAVVMEESIKALRKQAIKETNWLEAWGPGILAALGLGIGVFGLYTPDPFDTPIGAGMCIGSIVLATHWDLVAGIGLRLILIALLCCLYIGVKFWVHKKNPELKIKHGALA